MPETQLKLLRSLVVVLVFLLIRSIVVRIIRKNVADVAQRYRWSRGFTTAVGVLMVLFLVPTWFAGLESVATVEGILGAGFVDALENRRNEEDGGPRRCPHCGEPLDSH